MHVTQHKADARAPSQALVSTATDAHAKTALLGIANDDDSPATTAT